MSINKWSNNIETQEKKDWYCMSYGDVIKSLQSDEHGLSLEGAEARLNKYGPNQLLEGKTDGIFIIFLRQFQSSLIYILLVASIIVYAVGEYVDGSIILVVLIFNAIIGTVQEGKAQNTLQALKRFIETKATVRRDDEEMIIDDRELVPGDIIILQEGERVPADARVITSQNLNIDEAALTGESVPVWKNSDPITLTKSSYQKNMIYKGTNIVSGNGTAIVTSTGVNTTIGKIATQILDIDTEIPLKTDINRLSRLVIVAVILIGLIVLGLGIATNRELFTVLMTILSLSVSIVPAGLPVVVTLILATGVWRMSKRNALVKKLQAVEALGQARVVAVDKTGTITKNEMTVEKIYVSGKLFEVDGIGYEPKGDFKYNNIEIDAVNHPELLKIGKIASLCSSARVILNEEDGQWKVSGDPTEAALGVVAQKLGFHKEELLRECPLMEEMPFDYRLKYHAVLNKINKDNFLSVVGATEIILNMSKNIWRNGKSHMMSQEDREGLENTFAEMSADGLRVIGCAFIPHCEEIIGHKNVKDLTFLGFYGIKDAVRPEALGAIKKLFEAGMRVVMITGDHRVTAQAIAKETGIWREGDMVLTGGEIDEMSSGALSEKLSKVSVFSRVSPDHKMKIIQAYREKGIIIAMTGDGVNDAPPLVAADLGVSMGKIGTEVAKEASDIVLLDDNLESIVGAVEEGRSIYKTIKKVILYLFSTSLGEVFTIIGSMLIGFPLPLLPTQIIWLNFVTDGFLVASLAMEPKESGLLKRTFEIPKKYLIDKLMVYRMLIMSLIMTLGTLYIFNQYYEIEFAKAMTMSLTVLAVFQWFNAWNCRTDHKSVFDFSVPKNVFMIWATLTVIVLQILAIYTPIMQKVLKTVPLGINDWLLIVPVAILILFAEEVRKVFSK